MLRLLVIAVLVMAVACHRGARAPRFAVEGAGGSVAVAEDFGSDARVERSSLEPLSPALPAAGWESLMLHYAAESDGVQVTVYTMHEEYDPRRHATTFRSQKLATHLARLKDAIKLGELEKLGYQPLTLRVVAAGR